jgi:hypothetical protein
VPFLLSRCACASCPINNREAAAAIRMVLVFPVLIIVVLYYYRANHITRQAGEKGDRL